MKKLILQFIFLTFICMELSAQCPSFNLSMNQAPNYCFVKPFGVGRDAGNSDMSLFERGIYFDAYQSNSGVRYRYSNYQPMSFEYSPWSNELLIKYVDGSQNIVAGSEITSWKRAFSIENLTGKVKIGEVSSPGNYLLYVEKGILAEKIVVALKNTNDWADYVFDDDYQIMPLNQLQIYIEKHKHLPNIPTSEDMISNGNDLKETDKLLLEKIEELTLYIIQLNQRVQNLESQLEE